MELRADGGADGADLEEALEPLERRPAQTVLKVLAEGGLRLNLLEGHRQVERALAGEERVERGEEAGGRVRDEDGADGLVTRLRARAEQTAARADGRERLRGEHGQSAVHPACVLDGPQREGEAEEAEARGEDGGDHANIHEGDVDIVDRLAAGEAEVDRFDDKGE